MPEKRTIHRGSYRSRDDPVSVSNFLSVVPNLEHSSSFVHKVSIKFVQERTAKRTLSALALPLVRPAHSPKQITSVGVQTTESYYAASPMEILDEM